MLLRFIGESTIGYTSQPAYTASEEFSLTLIEGEWPTDKELLDSFGAIPWCGGGTVTHHDDGTVGLLIWGCN